MENAQIIYGYHAADEMIRAEPKRINHIWTLKGHVTPRVRSLVSAARRKKIPVRYVDQRALLRIAGSNRHQDIVLEVSPYHYKTYDELIRQIHDRSLLLILDEIQDITNLATLLRTAEGAGVTGVFLSARRSASITATVYRLSAGALEHLEIARAPNLAQCLESLQKAGVRVICADPSGGRVWHEVDYTGPIAILVGNEYKGVRRLLKEKSDEVVRIPMLGKLQSLNVHVTAAILLYEVIRQRG